MKKGLKVLLIMAIVFAVLFAGVWIYFRMMARTREKYMGHGFDFMHGYSTTDFSGYMVYDDEKLYHPDQEVSFQIEEEENMPVLDGAEACYPLYSAFAKAVYKDIGMIEKKALDEAQDYLDHSKNYDKEMFEIVYQNGKIVTFTNSVDGYMRLINREADLFFGARPSAGQKEEASARREQILSVPIGEEAFVFFVEEDNPIDNLSSQELRGIFHGDYTNWKRLGGKNEKIIAFQRPEDSGSQVMMKWFMGDVSLKEPKTFEYIGGMGDVIKRVAQYHNEKGAIGYSFRYFLEELGQEKGVKMLSVDGVYPSLENIKNGSYPLRVPLVCAVLASNEDPYVKGMIDFILSEEGQDIVEKTGYAPLNEKSEVIVENQIEQRIPEVFTCDNWTLYLYRDSENGDFELFNVDRYFKGSILNYEGNDEEWKKEYGPYSLVPYDTSFEIFFDEEGDHIVFKKIEEIKSGMFPPEEGSVFVKSVE